VPSTVRFEYHTGLSNSPFIAATLVGSWDAEGRRAPSAWTSRDMQHGTGDDGDVFFVDVILANGVGAEFGWGVLLSRPDGSQLWGVMSEVADLASWAQERRFTLEPPGLEPQREAARLTRHRWLGARPRADGRIAYTTWAPNALAVEVVFGGASCYIADDGYGIDASAPVLPMQPDGDGRWTAVADDFAAHAGRPYMYRLTRDDGRRVLRTDMYSLEQCGAGAVDPGGRHFDGTPAELDGTPSCSRVVDASRVQAYPDGGAQRTDAEFWAGEHDPTRPVPRRVEDLVIYELHIGALRPDTHAAGSFADAIELLPYLEELGVNAVELLPLFEFNGTLSWGYGSSHFLALETSAGGRDALKHFVKACHQRGMAVLMDVVYNHYTDDASRASWEHDSPRPSCNAYYWYEGDESRYVDPTGGYIDNYSSGWAPRYHDEHVRAMFVSSAAMLVDEFHVDGLRVDQTTSIHAYNRLHADGSAVPAANIFGRKFLRELCQTLKAIDPDVVLVAEDHSGWDAVTEDAPSGGIGFDAAWYVDFYHHLIGDKNEGAEYAKLLSTAARQHDGPLAMGSFAGALVASAGPTVVYSESHDEAGNATASRRTILAAVDGAPLIGDTRRVAEARTRFAAGMSLLAPGTPMFLMGEEVGAQKPYAYDRFAENKEDLAALREGDGAGLFAFHRDLIRLRLGEPDLRSRAIEVIHVNDDTRVLAFRRGDHLVVGSLAETPYDAPDYRIIHPSLGGGWRERFNSDAAAYGGADVGHHGATLWAQADTLGVVIPANGFVILGRVA
jgi:1,4-alpha-glucan branching enzyme